jgi:hypothetical protein
MSATNRGSKRREADFYPTPAWATRVALDWLQSWYPVNHVLDPCEGDRAILRVAHALGLHTSGIELRPEAEPTLRAACDLWRIADGLERHAGVIPAAVVVTNPPFSLAREFIERWAPVVPASLWLLRYSFPFTPMRANWFRRWPASRCLALPRRPCFVAVCKGVNETKSRKRVKGCGSQFPVGTKGRCECGGSIGDGTDATEYAWFAWERGYRGHTTALEIADPDKCR